MAKITICLSILLITGFAVLNLIDIQAEADQSLPEVAARDRKVREQELNYFAFKQSFEATLESLREGEMSLADACERVNGLAKRYNSEYFLHLIHVEPGTSQEARVAHNLVGHVASMEDVETSLKSHLPQLRVELAALLKQMASKR